MEWKFWQQEQPLNQIYTEKEGMFHHGNANEMCWMWKSVIFNVNVNIESNNQISIVFLVSLFHKEKHLPPNYAFSNEGFPASHHLIVTEEQLDDCGV